LIIDYSPRDALRQYLQEVEWNRGIKQMFRFGGSIALNMCLVAKGAVDGYVYGRVRNRVKSWDIAAAALLVQGAGGQALDRQGQPLDTFEPQGFVLCCNAQLDLYRLLGHDVMSLPTP
jgi:fructose-1,6-bisphosphatase/inositol monophosphatase family enzyme